MSQVCQCCARNDACGDCQACVVRMCFARDEYRKLRDRAIRESPVEEPYVRALWSDWDDTLAQWIDTTELRPHVLDLIKTISDPKMTPDARLEWLDAFPSAVADAVVAVGG